MMTDVEVVEEKISHNTF